MTNASTISDRMPTAWEGRNFSDGNREPVTLVATMVHRKRAGGLPRPTNRTRNKIAAASVARGSSIDRTPQPGLLRVQESTQYRIAGSDAYQTEQNMEQRQDR
jgi:hypothetical protein